MFQQNSAEGVPWAVEHLPSKCKVLCSKPSTENKNCGHFLSRNCVPSYSFEVCFYDFGPVQGMFSCEFHFSLLEYLYFLSKL
jgi:hypothetical protein